MTDTQTQKLAVVTGGAGFVGSHLCKRLVKEGYRVISLDNYFTGEIDRCAAQKTTLSKVNEVFNGTQTASEALREGQFILPRLKDAL